MPQGTVKWFNAEKGFGFIAPDDGSADVFAHYSAISTSGYRTLTDNHQILANMDERLYDNLIVRYSASWNAPPPASTAVAMLAPSMPTGKPTNADFPSAASTAPASRFASAAILKSSTECKPCSSRSGSSSASCARSPAWMRRPRRPLFIMRRHPRSPGRRARWFGKR